MVTNAGEMRVADVLKILPVSRVTLYELEKRGWIRAKRDYRNHRFFQREDVIRLQRRLQDRK